MSIPHQPTPSTAVGHQRREEPGWLIPGLLVIVAAFIVFSPWPLTEKLRATSRAVSASIPSHMLALGHDVLPMNARSTGIYLGVLVAVGLLLVTGRGRANRFPPTAPLALLAGFLLAMTVDGVNSLLTTLAATDPAVHAWYRPSNTVRVVTGGFAGLAMGLLSASVVNAVVWKHSAERVVEDLGELSGYLIVTVLVILIILRQLPALYWPLALLSVGGFLVLATMVNMITVVLSLRRERRATTWRETLPLSLAALILALGEVSAINLLHH